MTIRRHITATIDEIDDSVDSRSPTSIPVQPASEALDTETGTPTDFPDLADDDNSETHPWRNHRPVRPTVGRTFPDLVVEFKNDYRAMGVFLTIVPMLIFVAKIDSVESLKYPLIGSITLNVIWFGLPSVVNAFRWLRKRR